MFLDEQDARSWLIPERRLWTSVFLLGLQDFSICVKRKNRARKHERYILEEQEPYRWLYSDRKGAGSFVFLCELFDLDVARTRSIARLNWRQLL